MLNLDKNNYFYYTFPQPQYLGAKYKFLKWISKYIPSNINSVLDAFGGSQSVAFFFKQMGLKVYTNDFLKFNYHIGHSLIENKSTKLEKEEIDFLLYNDSPKKTLMQNIFTDIFFEEKETSFLDQFRANLMEIKNTLKYSLALTVMNRSLTRKVTMGHFAHLQALNYANNPQRVKRNPNLARPIKSIFINLISQYNNAVFSNQQNNQSFNQNILNLLPNLQNKKIDLVYFDPPYTNSHSDYQAFYHLLETFTQYWEDKQFINGNRRYYPHHWSGFDKKNEVISSIKKLFEYSEFIPYWMISWNDRSYPSIDDFLQILNKYKKVKTYFNTYKNSVGGKGSVKGSREVLFICNPK